jgi:hypothetical protein
VGARFAALVQTGPWAHPASYTVGTGFFSPGVKPPGRGVNHQPPSSADVKGRVELYLYSSTGPSWSVLGRACRHFFVRCISTLLWQVKSSSAYRSKFLSFSYFFIYQKSDVRVATYVLKMVF